jgi:hypothetical protein
MKIFILLLIFLSYQTHAQKILNDSLPYMSHGGELILSFSDASHAGLKSIPRLSGAIHCQSLINVNISRILGLYTGLALRNIGIIYKQNDSLFSNQEVKYKQRSYTLGIPLAIKIGNMNKKKFLYAGGEIEYAFAYKQKIFVGKHKDVFSNWFGKQVNPWQPSLFAGIQIRNGFNLKFKYYLNNFLNKDYTTSQNGQLYKPFANMNSHIWYVSVSTILSKKKKRKPVLREKPKEGIYTKYEM